MTISKEEYLLEAAQQHAEALARLEHTVNYSRSGLHAALLANGGALIGLFTLIAPQRDLAGSLWPSGIAFSIGMLLTLVAWFLVSYGQDKLQQSCSAQAWNCEANAYGRTPEHEPETYVVLGNCMATWAYVAAGSGIVAFIAGCLLTLGALA